MPIKPIWLPLMIIIIAAAITQYRVSKTPESGADVGTSSLQSYPEIARNVSDDGRFVANVLDSGEGEVQDILHTNPLEWHGSALLNPLGLEIAQPTRIAVSEELVLHQELLRGMAEHVRELRRAYFRQCRETGQYERAVRASEFSGPADGGFAFNGFLCPNGDPPRVRYWLLDYADPQGPKQVRVDRSQWKEYDEVLRNLTEHLEAAVNDIRASAIAGAIAHSAGK
jgi:hypothetical protein